MSRKQIYKSKVHLSLLQMAFPALIQRLLMDFNEEETLKTLYKIGSDMGKGWLKHYVPPGKNISISKIFKLNTKKTFGSLKIKFIKEKGADSFIFRYYQCPLCLEDIKIVSKVPYCASISGFYEGFLNELAKIKNLGFKKIKGSCIKSKSSGEEYCEHLFKIIE